MKTDRFKADKLGLILLAILAIAGTLVAAALVHITDRSQKTIEEIKAIKVADSQDTLAAFPREVETNSDMENQVQRRRNDRKVTFEGIAFTEKSFAALAQLKKATVLRLKGCTFDNKWLHYLQDLPSLVQVRFDGSSLNSEGIEEVCKIKQLDRLDFSQTDTTDGDIKFLNDNVIVLNLSDTKVTDACVPLLLKFKVLRELHLSKNQITDAALKEISKLSSLRKLEVGRTKITDDGLKYLQELPNLRHLTVARNSISDRGLAHLHKAVHLTALDIWGCPNVTDAGIAALQKALPHCRVRLVDSRTQKVEEFEKGGD